VFLSIAGGNWCRDHLGCSHHCHSTALGTRCICRRGFRLHPNGKDCIGIMPRFLVSHAVVLVRRITHLVRRSVRPSVRLSVCLSVPCGLNSITKSVANKNWCDSSNRCVNLQLKRSKFGVRVRVAQCSGRVLITKRTAAYHVCTRPTYSLVYLSFQWQALRPRLQYVKQHGK